MRSFFVLFISILFLSKSIAQTVKPDAIFNGTGRVQIQVNKSPVRNINEKIISVVNLPDNKIIGLGNDGNGGQYILKYNIDGYPDIDFGNNGVRSLVFQGYSGFAFNCVALQPDGKILLGGSIMNPNLGYPQALITRLNTDGTVDTSFYHVGLRVFKDDTRSEINDIAFDSNFPQAIVAAGYADAPDINPYQTFSLLVKIQPDGNDHLDLANPGGYGRRITAGQVSAITKIKLLGNSDIIFTGTCTTAQGLDVLMFGRSDKNAITYAGNVTTFNIGSTEVPAALEVTNYNQVYVAGTVNGDVFLGKLNLDGTAVTSYGGYRTGFDTLHFAYSNLCAGIKVFSNDKVLITATIDDGNNGYQPAIVLMDSTGYRDKNFNKGTMYVNTAGGFVSSMTTDGLGRIILSGQITGINRLAMIDRYLLPTSSLSQTISFPQIDVSGSDLTLNATSSSGLPVEFSASDYSMVSISGSAMYIKKTGTITITAYQPGDTMYAPASPVSQTITINKITPTLNFPAIPTQYIDQGSFLLDANLQVNGNINRNQVIEFISNDQSKIMIQNTAAPNKAKALMLDTGYVVLTAFFRGNTFTDSVAVNQTVHITKAKFFIKGKNFVAERTLQTYKVLPSVANLSYNWYYTGDSLEFVTLRPDSILKVFVNDSTTNGNLICAVTNQTTRITETLTLSITVNHSNTVSNQVKDIKCDEFISNCSGAYINSINIASINNSNTGCSEGGQADFKASSFTTDLYMDQYYSLKSTIGSNIQNQTYYFALWIDYNDDGDCDDSDEFIISEFDTDTTFDIRNIKIKKVENPGPRTLRVRVRPGTAFNATDACPQEGESGETEDYLVTLVAQPKLEAPDVITPNHDGFNDYLVIKGIESSDNKLLIYDKMGILKYKSEGYTNDWAGKDVDGNLLDRGAYFYVFTNGKNVIKGMLEIRY